MPRKTTFRPLAAPPDDAPQPRRVDHKLDLDAAVAADKALLALQALQVQQQAERVEAKPLRSGGAFSTTPADEPQRPRQRSAAPLAQPALLRRGGGRFHLGNEIAAAQDVDAPTAADDEHEVQPATTHVRRYAKPSAPFLGADGRLQATFDGPRGVETAVVLFCEQCGYGRTANDPETPDGNGFGEPNY